MANTNSAKSFYTYGPTLRVQKYPVVGSAAIAINDLVALDSAGRVILATATSAKILGAAQTPVTTSSAAGDPIYVADHPDQLFVAQSILGALADPYTTMTASASFDIVATTGAQYINSAASSYNVIQIIGPACEWDTGLESVVGSYMKQICKISDLAHALSGTDN